MTQRDTGRIVPPQPTGHKAVVVMEVRIMVEVNESDDYNHMVWQAKEQLQKRVLEGKGFYPFSSRCDVIHPDVEVEELRYQTEVNTGNRW